MLNKIKQPSLTKTTTTNMEALDAFKYSLDGKGVILSFNLLLDSEHLRNVIESEPNTDPKMVRDKLKNINDAIANLQKCIEAIKK